MCMCFIMDEVDVARLSPRFKRHSDLRQELDGVVVIEFLEDYTGRL